MTDRQRGTAPQRWVCHCQHPPVLLATVDHVGTVNIKVRDRYWHLSGFGRVHAVCPRCGGNHWLDLDQFRRQVTEASDR